MDLGSLRADPHYSRRLRLETLVRLRWLAVGGQAVTVAVVRLVFGFPMMLGPCLVLVGVLALANILLSVFFRPTLRLHPAATSALLALDLIQLSALLFITGGLANPFSVLICVPVTISFASQPIRQSLFLITIALVSVTVLAFSPFALPWYPDHPFIMDKIMRLGIWCAIVSTMGFAAFYAYRVSLEATQLADALAATELVLQRQKHLSQLDGLAAAAAHELGTPLATISVVAKEMERELGNDPHFGEDVLLLRSQSERCRDILRRLTTLSAEEEAHMRRLPLSSLIEEVLAPHRHPGITIRVVDKSGRTGEPVGVRNAGIIYGLGNLIENAVDYARSEVTITVEHTSDTVKLVIEDDGPGYAPDILSRIGEPYVTHRQREDSAGGLGLGLFIAKTLLERSGAKITFSNRNNRQSGAQIAVTWRRDVMDALN
ncbi:ActS/PrrB/RegB family redox-sensitive histidine kinase [Gellertiella hungarica]|uniref:histidine kinase n=1 Tax=Gellertiella hungarica TaxID=1572859 RepID=A0A7W6NMY5_9HYPH|nr:ActS/PrrB/RegB family redox-sensitive histidine kinase [Gellertiella hungarica]MBB4066910.1 two-component system sensor histidine kinase RegB [Gellertiella hungarica]